MEYVEGETLSAPLAREKRLDTRRALTITYQTGEALSAAHRLGIVHRDLKPDNIMLARDQLKDVVKVLDFGIAKLTTGEQGAANLTQTGFVVGTPYYMSPEQVKGEEIDARSDLYSLALIVYEMLSGERAFAGENSQSVMIKRVLESPRPLLDLNPAIPSPIASAVMGSRPASEETSAETAGERCGG